MPILYPSFTFLYIFAFLFHFLNYSLPPPAFPPDSKVSEQSFGAKLFFENFFRTFFKFFCFENFLRAAEGDIKTFIFKNSSVADFDSFFYCISIFHAVRNRYAKKFEQNYFFKVTERLMRSVLFKIFSHNVGTPSMWLLF